MERKLSTFMQIPYEKTFCKKCGFEIPSEPLNAKETHYCHFHKTADMLLIFKFFGFIYLMQMDADYI